MAEDVIIQGFGNGGTLPDFATEQTLKQLVAVMGKAAGLEKLKPEDLQKLANAIAQGDSNVSDLLKDMKRDGSSNADKARTELEKLNAKILNQIKGDRKDERERDKDAEETKSLLGNLKTVLVNIRTGIEEDKISVAEGIGAAIRAAGFALAPLAASAAELVAGVASLSNAYNSFSIELGQTRFDLANEIRQSGLATSLDQTTSSMMGFAEMVSESTFTFGQAAEMANKFSMAVGGAGIERSLHFVEQMALGGAEGANMMQRFGLEFGGVANMAGQYLETVRNLGMLDRMNNQQLRSGMEEFMETVTMTSNIMKINIQDAAEMIAGTLNQRDDLTTMLAGLPADMRSQVQNVVAAFGAQGTEFGNTIATALASGNMQNFVVTEQGQSLLGSSFGQQFLPVLESIMNGVQSGMNIGDVMSSQEGALRALADSLRDEGNRQLVLQNADPMIRSMGASILRFVDTIGDANAGNRADTTQPGMEDDREFVNRMLVQQRQANAMEKITNALAKSFDYAENLGELNRANLGLINEVEQTAIPAIEALAPRISDATTFIQSSLTDLGTALTAFAGYVTQLLPGDQGARREEIERGQAQATDTVAGGTPEELRAEVERRLEQERIRIREEQERLRREFETSDNLTRSDRSASEIERIFEGDRDRQIDRYTLDDGTSEFRMAAGAGMYTVVPEELANRLMSEREISRDMRNNLGNYEGVSDSFAYQLEQALFGSTDGIINSGRMASLLGVNSGTELATRTVTDADGNERQVIDDARFNFLKDMVNQLNERGSITREQMEALTNVLSQIDTTGIFKREATEQRDAAERDRLVAAITELTTTLNR